MGISLASLRVVWARRAALHMTRRFHGNVVWGKESDLMRRRGTVCPDECACVQVGAYAVKSDLVVRSEGKKKSR